MSSSENPFIDPTAADAWLGRQKVISKLGMETWLQSEVAQRLSEHLQVIRLEPKSWLHWRPDLSGAKGQALMCERYPQAQRVESSSWDGLGRLVRDAQRSGSHPDTTQNEVSATAGLMVDLQRAKRALQSWWTGATKRDSTSSGPNQVAYRQDGNDVQDVKVGQVGQVGPHGEDWEVDLVWSNLTLHHEKDPSVVLKSWLKHLKPGGVVVFSCFGPDTLQEIREVYRQNNWPAAMHPMTDLHDWGDMLIQCGFSEPVMDMERLTLHYREVETLLAELRTLGRNFHPQRTTHLRSRQWLEELKKSLKSLASSPGQGIPLTFEVIYGHAFKPSNAVSGLAVQAKSEISLEEMRSQLLARKKM